MNYEDTKILPYSLELKIDYFVHKDHCILTYIIGDKNFYQLLFDNSFSVNCGYLLTDYGDNVDSEYFAPYIRGIRISEK